MTTRITSKESKPKFRKGQVVCVKAMSPACYEKLAWFDEESEQWVMDSGYFTEDELRPLTKRERGSEAK